MAGATTRFALYLLGGGSSQEFVDEVLDADRHNDNFRSIDAKLGLPEYTSATRPASPGIGLAIWETDTQRIALFTTATGWIYPVPAAATFTREGLDIYVQATQPTGKPTGSLWLW